MSYGAHSRGMHNWVMDELELGRRVALIMDNEYYEKAEGMLWWYLVGNPTMEAMELRDRHAR
jgi:hypothetical protein